MLGKFLFPSIKATSAQRWRSARPSVKAGSCCSSQVRHLLREPSQHLLHRITNMADGLLSAVSADEVEEQLLLISPSLQPPGCDLRRPLQLLHLLPFQLNNQLTVGGWGGGGGGARLLLPLSSGRSQSHRYTDRLGVFDTGTENQRQSEAPTPSEESRKSAEPLPPRPQTPTHPDPQPAAHFSTYDHHEFLHTKKVNKKWWIQIVEHHHNLIVCFFLNPIVNIIQNVIKICFLL